MPTLVLDEAVFCKQKDQKIAIKKSQLYQHLSLWFKLVQVVSTLDNFHQSLSILKIIKP